MLSERTSYLTTKDVAERLHLSVRTVRDWLNLGKLGGQKLGRKWLIPEESLNSVLPKTVGPPTLSNSQPRPDPELGPHRRGLFYFGKRLRDRLTVPNLGAVWCRWVDRSPDMWEGFLSPSLQSPFGDAEPFRDAEEEAIEENWGHFRYDARRHPVLPLLEQHLRGYDCWRRLEEVEGALQRHREAWGNACQLAETKLRAMLREVVTQTDLETLRESLLQGAYNRARGYNVEFSYTPYQVRDGWSIDLSGKVVGHVAQQELLDPYIQVHKDLFDWLPDHPEVKRLVKSEQTLEKAIERFKVTLSPDDRLRKLILEGGCELCL